MSHTITSGLSKSPSRCIGEAANINPSRSVRVDDDAIPRGSISMFVGRNGAFRRIPVNGQSQQNETNQGEAHSLDKSISAIQIAQTTLIA